MGHIESGGATIFPLLNLTVSPERGTAVVWHNLKNDGSAHFSTWHSACPVVVGTKYGKIQLLLPPNFVNNVFIILLVLTKWIYSIEQMFIKPCLAIHGKSVSNT